MSSNAPQGVKISAYIFFALGALTLLGFCALLVVLGLAASSGEAADQAVGLGIGLCFTLIFAILYGAVGYGLMNLQSWARIAAIVLAILSLCSFPIGTILGGIVLYFMFQQDVQQAFS
jgi:hypothetical protein